MLYWHAILRGQSQLDDFSNMIVMANSSYLSCARKGHTYPSFQEPAFDSEEQTAAMGVSVTPNLWLALFRPQDMLVDRFVVPSHCEAAEGEKVGQEQMVCEEPAPVVERVHLEERWQEAYERLVTVLPQRDSLAEYGRALLDALATIGDDYPFVTIEMQEIAALHGPEYHESIRGVLAWFGGTKDPETVQWLEEEYHERTMPPLKMFLEGNPSDEEWDTMNLLLGGALYRDVPWSDV